MSLLAAVAETPTPTLELPVLVIVLLGVVAFGTAMLSAIVGMAGGIILLGTMLLFLDPIVVIPIHGAIQLVSNTSRATVQRRHLAWSLIWRYGLLLLPMGLLAIGLVTHAPQNLLKGLIGVFVLFATWQPRWLLLGSNPQSIDSKRRFILLGGVVGFLNIIVGAVGPFIAPFFLNVGLSRQTIVGTKAACQALGHVVKIILFIGAGFVFLTYVPLLAVMIPLVIVGTWVGSRLLDKLGEKSFVWLFKSTLTLVACWLLFAAVWSEFQT